MAPAPAQALHWAAYTLDVQALAIMLLGTPLNINAPDAKGRTPLHYASGLSEQLSALVYKFSEPPAGADLAWLAERTPSRRVMAADAPQAQVLGELAPVQLQTVRVLLAAGANASAAAWLTRATPLHLAARAGATDGVLRALVGAGADVHARDWHGRSPLHVASAGGHVETCLALLQLGADPTAADAHGRPPRWYAQAAGAAMGAAEAARLSRQWGDGGEAQSSSTDEALPAVDAVDAPSVNGEADAAEMEAETEASVANETEAAGARGSRHGGSGWGANGPIPSHPAWAPWVPAAVPVAVPVPVRGRGQGSGSGGDGDGGAGGGDDGNGDVTGGSKPEHPKRLDLCEFDRRAAHLPPGVFEAEYLVPSRPVVIVGGANSMRAKREWSRESFMATLGEEVLGAQKLPARSSPLLDGIAGEAVRLRDYFARWNAEAATASSPSVEQPSPSAQPPLMWNNPKNHTLWEATTAAQLSWPPALDVPRLRTERSHFGLFVGPRRSGISLHYHKAAWNALLFGRKLWVLSPPRHSRFRRHEFAAHSFEQRGWLEEAAQRARANVRGAASHPPAADELANATIRRYCVQREGDVIFVPAGWGHSTLNLEESVGVANFFLDVDSIELRPNKAFHSTRGIRSLQTAAGITSPSDYDPDGHP